MNGATRKSLSALLAALAPAGVAATWLGVRGEVPDPLPTHWDLHGRVDDTMSLGVMAGVTLGLASALALAVVVMMVRARGDRADRLVVAATTWAAWLAATVFVVPALLSRGATHAATVDLTWWAMAAIPALPTLAAAAVATLQPVDAVRVAAPTPAPSLRLGDNERVVWVGRSSSVALLALAAVLLVAAVFLVFTAWPVANLLALVAVALFWSHLLTLRVDDRAVTVAWGPARWPRLTVPLDEVSSARSEEIEPLRWGGWGYRVSTRGSAAVTRRGPGLVLERRGRRPLAVTVDAPEAAAELVNALVDRQARAGAR
jgi:hypothetical protein